MDTSDNAQFFDLKRDQFRKARGGRSHFINLECRTCKEWILLYQKDGPGPLIRLYLDRIHAPKELSSLQDRYTQGMVEQLLPLTCSKCKATIGYPAVYEKEKRLCFILVEKSITKRLPKKG